MLLRAFRPTRGNFNSQEGRRVNWRVTSRDDERLENLLHFQRFGWKIWSEKREVNRLNDKERESKSLFKKDKLIKKFCNTLD